MEKFQTFQVDQIRWSPRHGPGKGPWRICKFCLLGVLLPVIFLFIPLYMRFRALRPISLTLSPSDMKLLNHEAKVSTTWCEAQNLRMNSTFNAYLLPERPRLVRNRQRVTMEREMVLQDDVKEYWGFYLLSGSYFKVRACSRHEGASLVVIRSGKGAGQCAWLGELDSAEESDEESQEFQFQESHERSKEFQFQESEDGNEEFQFGTSDVKDEGKDNPGDIDTKMDMDKSILGSDSKEVMKYLENIEKWSAKSQNILIQTLLGLREKDKMANVSREQTKSRDFETVNGKKEMDNAVKFRQFKEKKQKEDAITLMKFRALKIQNEKKRAETLKKIQELNKSFLEEDNENVGSEVFDGEDKPDGEIENFFKSGKFNQTDALDNSNEEVRSSWSSSEEALVACEGVISLSPLDGATKCHQNASSEDLASSMIEITHMVEKTGFYYFIFSNENEITDNFISSKFEMFKTVFDVSSSTVKCLNTTDCSLPLTFWSEEHVVLEVPEIGHSSCEYEGLQGLTSYQQCLNIVRAESICQPRGKLYIVFLLLVPILILVFSYI